MIKEHRHRESKEKREFERATAAAVERKAKEAVAEAEGTVVAPVRPSRQNVPLPMNPETVPSEADRLEKEVIKFELSAELQASPLYLYFTLFSVCVWIQCVARLT